LSQQQAISIGNGVRHCGHGMGGRGERGSKQIALDQVTQHGFHFAGSGFGAALWRSGGALTSSIATSDEYSRSRQGCALTNGDPGLGPEQVQSDDYQRGEHLMAAAMLPGFQVMTAGK
jgi:hypothetical protein